MSDVTVAPPGAAPTVAPAPQAVEVPINPNPTFTPNPVGSQAPDKPVEHTPSDAVKRAFDRANRPQPKTDRPQRAEPKAAEARPGHNQPPEETPPEKFDLKKRPLAEQPRSERGTFAPRQRTDENRSAPNSSVSANQAQKTDQSQNTYPKLPEYAPFRDPPPRMAEHAKRDWHAVPETVRGEIGRMHQEMGAAYQQYRGDHEAMNELRPYQQMAQQHGVKLAGALSNYVNMEQKLRADPIGGLDVIIHNLNLVDPQTGKRLDLQDISRYVLSRTPEQLKQVQQGNMQSAASHQIGALHQKISGLENHLQQMQTAQQFHYTRSAVDVFADSHPRFDQLGDVIHAELQNGFDLETAYRRAELLWPATHADQTRNPPAQTRPADRSIFGAPDVTGSNPASRRPKQASGSPQEAVQNAMRRLNGHM